MTLFTNEAATLIDDNTPRLLDNEFTTLGNAKLIHTIYIHDEEVGTVAGDGNCYSSTCDEDQQDL